MSKNDTYSTKIESKINPKTIIESMISKHNLYVKERSKQEEEMKYKRKTKTVKSAPRGPRNMVRPSLYSNYVLSPDPCKERAVTLVICAAIKRDNSQARQVIRETWGKPGTDRDSPVVLLFFIGSPKPDENPDVQKQIQKEYNIYYDIVQGEYIEDYRNLTLKSIQALKWVSMECKQAKYVLKADDDVYVNLALLVKTLDEKSSELSGKPFVIGYVIEKSWPIRDPSNKWFTSWEDYPDQPYPRYANGGCGYAMTGSAAFAIRHAVAKVNFLKMEDVYITGVCAQQAGVPVLHDARFTKKSPKGRHLMNTQITRGDLFDLEEFYRIQDRFMKLNLMHRVFAFKHGLNDVYESILGIPRSKLFNIKRS